MMTSFLFDANTSFFQATQVLYNYRTKFAAHAIHVVLDNLCKWLNIKLSDLNDEWDRLSDLAEDLLRKRRFIFKGGEPPGEVILCLSLNMHTILITINSFVQMEYFLMFLLLRRSNRIFPRIPRAELYSKQVHLSVGLHLQLLR